ncbi:glutamate receptor-interacting protein 2 [Trichonephila clavata]|uniref:Glutamate receptor-interacting protein 2 n=1 Tax=Trichonephila clavata TaxID=2740835 RepID=A0A8X6FQF4_TRICU|nr:glutamate receptor-interacting protein 2 [Trichonephila clavata]
MLVCQTAYEALLESIQLCSVNARQVIDVGAQMDEVKDSTVCEGPTCEESSYSDIEVSTDAVNIENEARSNLSEKYLMHTGVSPYQLVHGRLPSGPMTILKEFWTGEREIPTGAARSVEEYLKQLQKKLQDVHEIASENSAKNQERPAKVVKLTRPHSCLVRIEDGNIRELHVNKLRPYISRVDHVGIIFDQDTDFGELHYAPTDKENQPNIDIELNQMPDVLNAQQKYQLRNLLQRYEDIFRNRPGKARVKGHSVKVTADSSPKRLQPYRVPIALQKEVELIPHFFLLHSALSSTKVRSAVLQVGDRILAINGESTEGMSIDKISNIIENSHPQISMITEFDVAEAVVPSSGIFIVKLAKKGSDLGISLTARNREYGEPLIISDIKKGSIAHRTGTIQPGDKLLAINSLRTENFTVDDATAILHTCTDVVKLRIRKDETFSEDPDATCAIVYTVELVRHGGPLGITVSGTKEPFDPIFISGLTENGLAERYA